MSSPVSSSVSTTLSRPSSSSGSPSSPSFSDSSCGCSGFSGSSVGSSSEGFSPGFSSSGSCSSSSEGSSSEGSSSSSGSSSSKGSSSSASDSCASSYNAQSCRCAPSAPQTGQSGFRPSSVQAVSQMQTRASSPASSARTGTGSILNTILQSSIRQSSRFFIVSFLSSRALPYPAKEHVKGALHVDIIHMQGSTPLASYSRPGWVRSLSENS